MCLFNQPSIANRQRILINASLDSLFQWNDNADKILNLNFQSQIKYFLVILSLTGDPGFINTGPGFPFSRE